MILIFYENNFLCCLIYFFVRFIICYYNLFLHLKEVVLYIYNKWFTSELHKVCERVFICIAFSWKFFGNWCSGVTHTPVFVVYYKWFLCWFKIGSLAPGYCSYAWLISPGFVCTVSAYQKSSSSFVYNFFSVWVKLRFQYFSLKFLKNVYLVDRALHIYSHSK